MSDDGKTENGNKSPGETKDEFSLDSLRLSQDFASTAGVRKVITVVPVRKPDRQWFVRVHTDSAYRLDTAILELKDERESYLVAPSLRDNLLDELSYKAIFTAITRQGDVFLWPIPLPGADGRHNQWHRSQLAAAERARSRWIRMSANMSAKAYDLFEAASELSEPEWPDIGFQELLDIAFPPERRIDSLDHDVVKRLRGQA